jgi:predicted alpha/beta-hydrolase family hydrolase
LSAGFFCIGAAVVDCAAARAHTSGVGREEVRIDVPGHGDVGGLWQAPRAPRESALLLAHGAGAGMEHPLLAAVADSLVAHGFAVLRFRYPYMERAAGGGARGFPDPMPLLEEAHFAALAELARRAKGRRLLLAGKSMGGRVATHLAAKGADCAGLVLLGYPLHPPGRPERMRSEHFPAIAQPALFLEGTRDPHCDLALLEKALSRYGGTATVERVEGGDHDFARAGHRDPAERGRDLAQRIERWESAQFPS